MKKQIKRDVAELIIGIQQQLVSLERKIDALSGARQDRDRGRGERVLYKAICADCNKECEVPFRPSGDRPVYCKECFSSRKDFPQQRPFEKYRKKPSFKIAKSKKRG